MDVWIGRGETGERGGEVIITDLFGTEMVERTDEDGQSCVDADHPSEREEVVDR